MYLIGLKRDKRTNFSLLTVCFTFCLIPYSIFGVSIYLYIILETVPMLVTRYGKSYQQRTAFFIVTKTTIVWIEEAKKRNIGNQMSKEMYLYWYRGDYYHLEPFTTDKICKVEQVGRFLSVF